MTAFPNMKLTTIPLHSQCINCPNQLLEELNDWVHKTKWVVESLWVLIDIWLNTIGSTV